MKRKESLKFISLKKWLHLLLTVMIVTSMVMLNAVSVNADTTADTTTAFPSYTYLSLGDSIAYGMSAAPGSDYVHLFYNYLVANQTYGQLGLNNLAVCGDTSSNLLKKLQTDSSYIAAVRKAKVITISIGGNNLLSPVISSVCTAFGVNSVKNPNLMSELSKAIVNNPNRDIILAGIAVSPALAQSLQAGIGQFGIDFPKIIGTIKTISPQTQIYVLSLYNPFNLQDLLYIVFNPLINRINQVINSNAESGYKVADVYTKFKTTTGAVNFDLAEFQLNPDPTTAGHKAIYEAILDPSYTVRIDTLTGGSITASATAAASGSAVTLTVTPDAGMQLKAGSLKYNDGSSHNISGISFIMPAANITVSAVFEPIPNGGRQHQ